ncbi:MAG: SUMF1/EgtB/PvdO family nonheme iron enzyme [Myxococcota bacterium]
MAWVLLCSSCVLSFDRSRIPESCAGLAECLPGVSCCARGPVPGGSFDRGFDQSGSATQPGTADPVTGWQAAGAAPATVSDFSLERFEVTAGRMQAFLRAYDAWRAAGHPRVGEGALPALGPSSGWQPDFDGSLPTSAAALLAELRCPEEGAATVDGDPLLPINCVRWSVALAFCLWEGGRLPTEAEWSYAAAGGSEARAFPWSVPASALLVDADHVVLEPAGSPARVGSRAALDASRWGHHDLAGNVREWVLDHEPSGGLGSYGIHECVDCAELGGGSDRVRRGGDFDANVARARTAFRGSEAPTSISKYHGFRCAFD